MQLVPLLEDSFDPTLPLPFDLYDMRGRVLARKDFIIPRRLYGWGGGLGKLFITQTEYEAWQKRLVAKVNELIKDPTVTLSDIAKTIPDLVPKPDEPYISPAQRTLRQATLAMEDLQELVLQLMHPPRVAIAPTLEVARQLQPAVEQCGDFGLFLSHQQLRQKSRTWVGALVCQMTLLGVHALRDDDLLDTQLRKNLLGISLLLAAGVNPQRPAAHRQSAEPPEDVAKLPVGCLPRLSFLASLLCKPNRAAHGLQRLIQLYVQILSLLEDLLGRCAPEIIVLRRQFDSAPQEGDQGDLAGIRAHYGQFFPGQFVRLANREVGVVVSTDAVLGVPHIVRVQDAQGIPLLEPLPTKLQHPPHQVVEAYSSENMRATLDYRQILERVPR